MKNNPIKSVGIIGFGRFGKTLASLLKNEFEIIAYDAHHRLANLEDVLAQTHIFVAVPIRHFESVIKSIAPQLKPGTTVLDVCSVKVHPANVMQHYLPKTIGCIATHPLFGPDSIHSNTPLKIMMHALHDPYHAEKFWCHYFKKKNLEIINITPNEHDQQAALSQSITHFIGRVLQEAGIKPTQNISTLGFEKLISVMEQTCHDSWELFCDMEKYNPYAKDAIEKLSIALNTIKNKLMR